MPRTYRRKRRVGRRANPSRLRYRRRYRTIRRRRNVGSRLTRSRIKGFIMPDRMFVKLRYFEAYTQTAASYVTWLWRGNSLYDPNASGTGGQPTGYDEWSRFYNKVVVLGAKIEFEGVSLATGISEASIWALRNYEATPTTPGATFPELPIVTSRFVVQSGAGTTPRFRLKLWVKTSKIWGVSSQEVKDNDDFAHAASNPINGWTFCTNSWATTGGNASVAAQVKITYYCMFKEKILNMLAS